MNMHPPRSTLFPYTTLFRSEEVPARKQGVRVCPAAGLLVRDRRHALEARAHQRGAPSRLAGRAPDLGADEGHPSSRARSEEHTFELQSHSDLVCRLLLEKKK